MRTLLHVFGLATLATGCVLGVIACLTGSYSLSSVAAVLGAVGLPLAIVCEPAGARVELVERDDDAREGGD